MCRKSNAFHLTWWYFQLFPLLDKLPKRKRFPMSNISLSSPGFYKWEKKIFRAEENPGSKEPDPSRPARDLSSESHHTNSQTPSRGAVRAHCWKWILYHPCKSYIKSTAFALRLEHWKWHFILLFIWCLL